MAEAADETEDIPELEVVEEEPVHAPRIQEQPAFTGKKRRIPTLLRLTRRATVFLSFTLAAITLFFITGNRQTFLDSNLILILNIMSCNAIALLFFSALAALECIFYLIKDRFFKLAPHLFCYIIIFALSLALTIFSLAVNLLSEGISF